MVSKLRKRVSSISSTSSSAVVVHDTSPSRKKPKLSLNVDECLFCGSKIKKPSTASSTFERNAFTVFLMLEILEVSEELCDELLATNASPKDWFSCCQVCLHLGSRGMSIHCQVEALNRSFKRIKNRLRGKVKGCLDRRLSGNSANESDITHRLRSCVFSKSGGLEPTQTKISAIQGGKHDASSSKPTPLSCEANNNENPTSYPRRQSAKRSGTANKPSNSNSVPGSSVSIASVDAFPTDISVNSKLSLTQSKVKTATMATATEKSSDSDVTCTDEPEPPSSGLLSKNQETKYIGLSCRFCRKKFPTSTNARRHERNLHPKLLRIFSNLCCTRCGVKFQKSEDVERHQLECNSTDMFSEDKPYTVEPLVLLSTEMKNAFICSTKTCLQEFESAEILAVHRRRKHPERSILKFLSSTSKLSALVKAEPTSDVDDNTSIAAPTEKEVTEDEKVVQNSATNTFEKIYLCENENCGRKFRSEKYRDDHVARDHDTGGQARPYRCNICGKRFPRQAHVVRHLRLVHKRPALKAVTVTTESDFICSQCGKDFFRRVDKINHERRRPCRGLRLDRSRSKRKNVTADEDKSILLEKEQKNNNADEKKLSNDWTKLPEFDSTSSASNKVVTIPCTMCDMEFTDEYKLNGHVGTIHGTEKQFLCRYCHKGFTHASDLRKHETKADFRSVGKPESVSYLVCPVYCCRWDIPSHAKLRAHVAKHHPQVETLECHLCEMVFAEEDKLKNHISEFHKVSVANNGSNFGKVSLVETAPVTLTKAISRTTTTQSTSKPIMTAKTSTTSATKIKPSPASASKAPGTTSSLSENETNGESKRRPVLNVKSRSATPHPASEIKKKSIPSRKLPTMRETSGHRKSPRIHKVNNKSSIDDTAKCEQNENITNEKTKDFEKDENGRTIVVESVLQDHNNEVPMNDPLEGLPSMLDESIPITDADVEVMIDTLPPTGGENSSKNCGKNCDAISNSGEPNVVANLSESDEEEDERKKQDQPEDIETTETKSVSDNVRENGNESEDITSGANSESENENDETRGASEDEDYNKMSPSSDEYTSAQDKLSEKSNFSDQSSCYSGSESDNEKERYARESQSELESGNDDYSDSEMSSDEEETACPQCGKQFPSREAVEVHVAKRLPYCVMKSAMKRAL